MPHLRRSESKLFRDPTALQPWLFDAAPAALCIPVTPHQSEPSILVPFAASSLNVSEVAEPKRRQIGALQTYLCHWRSRSRIFVVRSVTLVGAWEIVAVLRSRSRAGADASRSSIRNGS